ncbi:MAG TPA: tetratricopeptide repeat protein, partial [Chitinophagaceae bacterium]
AKLPSTLPQDIVKDPWYDIVMGAVSLNNGLTTEARQHFDAAVKATRGKNVDILAAVARINIHSNSGDRNYAVELLDKAIRRDKRNPELYTMKGDAYFRLRNGNEAYRAFDQAIKLDSRYAPALYELGKIFSTQNNEALYLKYYNETVAADPSFAPAWYNLFYHYYKTDVNKALEYYQRYLQQADVDAADEYQLADLLYLTKQYDAAIRKANSLLAKQDAENRLNKLVGYTYSSMNKPDSALEYMNRYFNNGADTNFLVKDYEMMIGIYDTLGLKDSVVSWYQKILPLVKDDVAKRSYYRKLAEFYGDKKDYRNQATWLGRYYSDNDKATNLDLFNWGLALYQGQQYQDADSVFTYYSEKYPDQVFGFYWQARSKALIDSTMEKGLAIPAYMAMMERAEQDTSNATNRRYLVEAYGYIAAYTANEKKDYQSAIEYFRKLLALDPANADAKRYIEILERTVKSKTDSEADKGTK